MSLIVKARVESVGGSCVWIRRILNFFLKLSLAFV